MAFVKQDIDFVQYSWDMEDEVAGALFSGAPSRRIFDPLNGHQVLFLINYYAMLTGQFRPEDAHLMENRLVHKLPLGKMSELSVIRWMTLNK